MLAVPLGLGEFT